METVWIITRVDYTMDTNTIVKVTSKEPSRTDLEALLSDIDREYNANGWRYICMEAEEYTVED